MIQSKQQSKLETASLANPPHATLLDVVYVVREGKDNESLRYSLRSLANLTHGKVYISGGKPDWVINVGHIKKDVEMEMPDQEDSNLNLYLATGIPEISENFVFMNDDFFIMRPGDLPYMHQGSLDDRIRAYRSDHRFHQAYSLIKTKQELIRRGYGPQLFSYELHMPMVFNKARLRKMFDSWGEPLFALRPRTMYGNMYKLNGVNTPDAKNSINPEERFLSTGSDFDISIAGDRVRSRFNQQSTYESTAIPTRTSSIIRGR